MLLILGDNEGKGLALCRSLAEYEIYAAYSDYSVMIENMKKPPEPKSVFRRKVRDDSMDYYLELYRLDTEEEHTAEVKEANLSIPGAVLFLPTSGEHKPMGVLALLSAANQFPVTLALCENPPDFCEYMKHVDQTVFAREDEADQIAAAFIEALKKKDIDFQVIRYGKLRFYQDEHQAYLYGKPLCLTPSEYKVLRFLAFHRGKPFDAENIMQYCFPSTFLRKTSNAVTHICRINQKSQEKGKTKLIRFLFNKGYCVMET